MKRRIKVAAALAGAVTGSVAAAVVGGTIVWNRATAFAVARLVADKPTDGARVFSYDQLEGLPEPVVRYFKFALPSGQPLIRRAQIEHAGGFRSALSAPWNPFTSVQHIAVNPPGFVWDAAIRIAPLLTVRVRDSYLDGAGAMQGKLASLVTVVDESHHAELDAGALHRYLAEAVWFPTALLPNQGVQWEAIDDTRALATLQDGRTTVSLQFEFNSTGEIVRVFTPARYRDVNEKAIPTPWAGCHRSYVRVDGVMVPTEGEVQWLLPEGQFSYWRGTIRNLKYGFNQ